MLAKPQTSPVLSSKALVHFSGEVPLFPVSPAHTVTFPLAAEFAQQGQGGAAGAVGAAGG